MSKKEMSDTINRQAWYDSLPLGQVKKASLLSQLAGTLHRDDFADLESEFSDEKVASALGSCSLVMDLLASAASRPPAEKTASSNTPGRMDVVQIVPTRYGYSVKWAAAPDGAGQVQQQQMTAPQAQEVLPPEALQQADQQGVATMTGVEAEPDPLEETPAPIEGFGIYKVYEAGSDNQLVGFVIPQLYDPVQGQPVQMALFTNGGQYALQPSMVGNLVTVAHNLPEAGQDPRGLGVFYKTNGRNVIATVPYTIVSKATIEGKTAFTATTMEGVEIQITPSEGLKKPVAASPQEVVVPLDFSWMPLNNEIQVADGEAQQQDVMAQEKQAAALTAVEIRAWRSNGTFQCDLQGPAFEKVGSGTHSLEDALFYLAASGMPQNLSMECIKTAAADSSAVTLYGLRPLLPEEEVGESLAMYLSEKRAGLDEAGIKPHCLLREALALGMDKEAMDLVGADSIDHILSLNFINERNVEKFVEYLPDLEATQSKLASLVLAGQLGLRPVSKTAAKSAMDSLEEVITGLKSVKKFQV